MVVSLSMCILTWEQEAIHRANRENTRANGRNIVGQQLSILLDVTCCVRLHSLLHGVAQSLKPIKVLTQQLQTFLLFCDGPSVAQQCWIHFHSSSNIVGATHAHWTWSSKSYGWYPLHDTLHAQTLLHQLVHHCQQLPFVCTLLKWEEMITSHIVKKSKQTEKR